MKLFSYSLEPQDRKALLEFLSVLQNSDTLRVDSDDLSQENVEFKDLENSSPQKPDEITTKKGQRNPNYTTKVKLSTQDQSHYSIQMARADILISKPFT